MAASGEVICLSSDEDDELPLAARLAQSRGASAPWVMDLDAEEELQPRAGKRTGKGAAPAKKRARSKKKVIEESEEEIDTESVVLEQLHELALRHAKKSERQPYIVGQLRHGAEITIMLDSGCAAKGAICEEHLLQWRKEGKLDQYTSHINYYDAPAKIKGVEGAGAVQCVGNVLVGPIRVKDINNHEHFESYDCMILRRGSTGDAIIIIGNPTFEKKQMALDFGTRYVKVKKPTNGPVYEMQFTWHLDNPTPIRLLRGNNKSLNEDVSPYKKGESKSEGKKHKLEKIAKSLSASQIKALRKVIKNKPAKPTRTPDADLSLGEIDQAIKNAKQEKMHINSPAGSSGDSKSSKVRKMLREVQERSSSEFGLRMPTPKTVMDVIKTAAVAVLVLSAISLSLSVGTEQLTRCILWRNGAPMRNTTFIPAHQSLDQRLELMGDGCRAGNS